MAQPQYRTSLTTGAANAPATAALFSDGAPNFPPVGSFPRRFPALVQIVTVGGVAPANVHLLVQWVDPHKNAAVVKTELDYILPAGTSAMSFTIGIDAAGLTMMYPFPGDGLDVPPVRGVPPDSTPDAVLMITVGALGAGIAAAIWVKAYC